MNYFSRRLERDRPSESGEARIPKGGTTWRRMIQEAEKKELERKELERQGKEHEAFRQKPSMIRKIDRGMGLIQKSQSNSVFDDKDINDLITISDEIKHWIKTNQDTLGLSKSDYENMRKNYNDARDAWRTISGNSKIHIAALGGLSGNGLLLYTDKEIKSAKQSVIRFASDLLERAKEMIQASIPDPESEEAKAGRQFLEELEHLPPSENKMKNFEERFHTTIKRRTKEGQEPATKTNRQDFFRIDSRIKGIQKWFPSITPILIGNGWFRSDINPRDGIIKFHYAFRDKGKKVGGTQRMFASEVIANHVRLAREAVGVGTELPTIPVTKIVLNNVIEFEIFSLLRPYAPKSVVTRLEISRDSDDQMLRDTFFSMFTTRTGKAVARGVNDINDMLREQGSETVVEIKKVTVHYLDKDSAGYIIFEIGSKP